MFTHREEHGKIVVAIEGNLDEEVSQKLHEYIRVFIESGYSFFVLDCSKVGYICSSGLAVLCSIRSQLQDKGKGWVRLAVLSQDIKDVLAFVMVTDMIGIYETVEESLEV